MTPWLTIQIIIFTITCFIGVERIFFWIKFPLTKNKDLHQAYLAFRSKQWGQFHQILKRSKDPAVECLDSALNTFGEINQSSVEFFLKRKKIKINRMTSVLPFIALLAPLTSFLSLLIVTYTNHVNSVSITPPQALSAHLPTLIAATATTTLCLILYSLLMFFSYKVSRKISEDLNSFITLKNKQQ